MFTGLQKIVEDKYLIPRGTTLQETSSFEKWNRNTKVRKTVQLFICCGAYLLSTK